MMMKGVRDGVMMTLDRRPVQAPKGYDAVTFASGSSEKHRGIYHACRVWLLQEMQRRHRKDCLCTVLERVLLCAAVCALGGSITLVPTSAFSVLLGGAFKLIGLKSSRRNVVAVSPPQPCGRAKVLRPPDRAPTDLCP